MYVHHMFMFPVLTFTQDMFIEHDCYPVTVSILETYLWYSWNYGDKYFYIDTSEYSDENK